MFVENAGQFDTLISLKRPIAAATNDGGSIITETEILNDFFVQAIALSAPLKIQNGLEASSRGYRMKARAPLDIQSGDIVIMDGVKHKVIDRIMQARFLIVEFVIEEI